MPKIESQRMAEAVLEDWLVSEGTWPIVTGEYMMRYFPGHSLANVLAALNRSWREGLIKDDPVRPNSRNWQPSRRFLASELKKARAQASGVSPAFLSGSSAMGHGQAAEG